MKSSPFLSFSNYLQTYLQIYLSKLMDHSSRISMTTVTERNFHQNGEDYRYFCSFHNGENEYSFSLCMMKLSFLFDTDPDIPVTMPRLGTYFNIIRSFTHMGYKESIDNANSVMCHEGCLTS